MAIDARKIRKYHQLKRTEAAIIKQVKELNKQIKEELDPGYHQIGDFDVNITLKRKYKDIDYFIAKEILSPEVLDNCIKIYIDPGLVESAYLRDEITDDQMRVLRGEAMIIPSLTVERVDDVQTEL